MKKKYITLIGCILIILFFSCCCILEFRKNKSNNLTNIKVAEVTHSIFYAPQYIAIENGYFEEEGLEIELILTPGADNVTAAVLSGDVQIGLSGSEATIYVYQGKAEDYIKTFAQLTQKDGSFLVSRKEIKNFSINDLKNKHVIAGRLGGMPEMTLEWVLKENNINPKTDLKLDTSIQFASMASAFIGGEGDFVSLFEPLATQVVNQGYGYKVASLGELGGVVPYTAYNAKTSFIENNKELIKSFTRAIQKGLDYVNKSNNEQIATKLLPFFPDTSFNDLTNAVKSYKESNAWPATTDFSKESFDHLQNIIVSAGQYKEDEKVNYKDLIYVE